MFLGRGARNGTIFYLLLPKLKSLLVTNGSQMMLHIASSDKLSKNYC